MKILLDFIPFQHEGGVGGAASFNKRICDEIVNRRTSDTSLFAIYDSRKSNGKLYDIDVLSKTNNIMLFDVAKKTIRDYIRDFQIDVFFIAIGQFYSGYDLTGINCRTIMFIHDIFDIERCDNMIDTLLFDKYKETYWQQTKRYINLFSGRWEKQAKRCYNNIMKLYAAPNVEAYTVSHYTKKSLEYYFPQLGNKVKVCYSPLKEAEFSDTIENNTLKELVVQKKQYIMLIAANRRYKNPKTLMKVFDRLHNQYPELHLLTLKYGRQINDRHIDINFLSDSDLENAYKNAYALIFASFFEGFGYPPIEALRHGTPVIASNVTSIPEIVGNAGEYFSPFYPADLYRAITKILDNRDCHKKEQTSRLEEVRRKQNEDLTNLISSIFISTNKSI